MSALAGLIIIIWVRSYWVQDDFVWHARAGGYRNLEIASGAVYICIGSRRADARDSYGYMSHWSYPDPSPWEANYGIPAGRWRAIHFFSIRGVTLAATDPLERVIAVSLWLIISLPVLMVAAASAVARGATKRRVAGAEAERTRMERGILDYKHRSGPGV
jgi:hypothetical protein